MPARTFVYVTYIRTTPERLWNALTDPAVTRQYWFGMHQESTWEPGSSWSLHFQGGRVADAGKVLEVEKPRHLVPQWRNQFQPELANGWPMILSSLKSLLETGAGLPRTDLRPTTCG